LRNWAIASASFRSPSPAFVNLASMERSSRSKASESREGSLLLPAACEERRARVEGPGAGESLASSSSSSTSMTTISEALAFFETPGPRSPTHAHQPNATSQSRKSKTYDQQASTPVSTACTSYTCCLAALHKSQASWPSHSSRKAGCAQLSSKKLEAEALCEALGPISRKTR
jgi:hypothetical protein